MRPGRRPQDPREFALRDLARPSLDGDLDDPRMAALEDLAAGDMDEDASDFMQNPAEASMGTEAPRYDIGEEGILEDEVAMPGGGASPIDDLEEMGLLTPDLLRKARPSVWQHMESGRELEPYRGSLRGHSGPATEAYARLAGDTAGIDTPDANYERLRAYRDAQREASLKDVTGLPDNPHRPDNMEPYGALDIGDVPGREYTAEDEALMRSNIARVMGRR